MSPSWRDLTSARRSRPPVVRGFLLRPQLYSRFRGARVLLLVAPAGFGKTTTVASPWPGRPEHVAWLTLDVDDIDPQAFAASLAMTAENLPGGEVIGKLLDEGAPPRRVAARFADLLDACSGLLVLDDAQYLSASLLPELVHELLDCGRGQVMLLSRIPLSLAEFAPLQAAGELLTFSAADLAFSAAEISQIFAQQGVDLNSNQVGRIQLLTEGWPIAVRFLGQALAQGRISEAQLADLEGAEPSLASLFAYLAQEVLDPLAVPLRDVLTRGSPFDELTPELLREVLDEPQADALLKALATSGTFLTLVGTNTYRAHPLLRAHLQASLSPEQRRSIAQRAAAYFERTGHPRRALSAHLHAGQTKEAAALLATHGQHWLQLGRNLLVSHSLERLPHTVWSPELYALLGDVRRLSSRYEDALAAYEKAGGLAGTLGRARVALDTVQPDLGWAALEEARSLAQGAELEVVRRLYAENLLNAGDLSGALELVPELVHGTRYALRSGDVKRALELARQAVLDERHGERASQNHRESLLLCSFLRTLTGDAAQGRKDAQAGQLEGERLGSPFVRSLALAREGHALVVLGETAEAQHCYEQALALAQDISDRLYVEPLMGLSYLSVISGELARAQHFYHEALRRVGGDTYMRGLVYMMLALGLVHTGREASEPLLQAQQAFQACGDQLGQAACWLAQAEQQEHALPQAADALHRYPFLLGRRSLLSPQLELPRRVLLLARCAQASQLDLSAAAQQIGYKKPPQPEQVPGFEIKVQVLGRVQVQRSHEHQVRDWGRARARDLLLLLSIHPDGISRESAQEILFPEVEPNIGERNFRVTLHALGQVLEEGVASGTFLRRGEWIELIHRPELQLDLWQLRQILLLPAGTPGRLDKLLATIATLADSDFEEIRAESLHLHRQIFAALLAEASWFWSHGDVEHSARAAERAWQLDPAAEEAAVILMRAWHRRPAQVRRVYQELERQLSHLGLRPSGEVKALLQMISP